MRAKTAEIIKNIRSRPARERRVLGVALYLSIAAIIFALWAASLDNALLGQSEAIEPADEITFKDSEKNGSALEEKTAGPKGPLEALAGAFSEMTIGIKSIASEFKRLQDEPEAQMAESQQELYKKRAQTEKTIEPENPAATNKAAETPKKSEITATASESSLTPASALFDLGREPYSADSASNLLSSAPELRKAEARLKNNAQNGRLAQIAAYNFGELRRTINDIREYLVR